MRKSLFIMKPHKLSRIIMARSEFDLKHKTAATFSFICSNCNGCLVKKYYHFHPRNAYYSAPFRQGGACWLIGVGLLRVLRSVRAGDRLLLPGAVLSKGRVSMICLSASLTICSKVEEVLFPRRPFELLFFLLLNYLYIYFEIIVSGCRSWNSMTSCPFQLWQP